MLKSIKRSWKTSLAGVSALLTVVVKVVTTGQFDLMTDLPAVVAALGLIVAKDGDVSGQEPK